MRGRAQRILNLTALAAILAAGSLAAQTSEPASPSFAESVDVRVVNVEVVATDRRGERVTGLVGQDFRLFVDGKDVPIDYFTEVAEGRAVPRRQGGAEAVPSLLAGEAVGRRILVFIDDYFAIPIYRNRVLANLETQLGMLRPEDRMAIVAFDGRQIELLSPWTGSPAELEAALDRAMDRSAYGLRRRSDFRRFDTSDREAHYQLQSSSSFSSIGFLGGRRRDTSFDLQSRVEVEDQIERVVRAAASTLRGFAMPAGRKVMLLLTGGWPAVSAERTDTLIAGSRRLAPEERFAVLEPLIETANRLGYTLYPVDLQPLGSSLRSAEFGSLGEAEIHGARRGAMASDSADSLVELALATGGKSFESAANRVAFQSTLEDTRSYYWLGFAPRWHGDDHAHRLRIEVTRPGVRLRNRTGFTDLSRASELDLVIEGAQLFGTEIPGADLDVELGSPLPAGRGIVEVPLTVHVPLRELTLLPRGEELLGAVEIRLSARDDTGAEAKVPARTLEIRRRRPPAAGEFEPWKVDLKLRDRPHTLLVAIYEPATGEMWSKRLELRP